MNKECTRIAHQLASTISGEAWYGDSLRQILDGVKAKQAQAHPIPGAHSIWELLCHVEAWVKFSLGAVDGIPIPQWPGMPVELDWPPVADTSERAWKHTVDSFFSHHRKLVDAIQALSDERLAATVPGRTYNFYQLFQGNVQHAIYHGGQITLLKKMPVPK
jgi:DinB superfamily